MTISSHTSNKEPLTFLIFNFSHTTGSHAKADRQADRQANHRSLTFILNSKNAYIS